MASHPPLGYRRPGVPCHHALARPGAAGREDTTVRELAVPWAERLMLILIVGSVLGGCAIPFGNGGDPSPSYQSPEETRRDRNRLYMEEQQRMERERQFDRIGPSDR
jgi:hypothetical protein